MHLYNGLKQTRILFLSIPLKIIVFNLALINWGQACVSVCVCVGGGEGIRVCVCVEGVYVCE